MALVQPVKDGKMVEKKAVENTSKDRTGTGELGKDAFLQLLVAQMKYQDPLNPTSDTEYIAQLAQFSQLEQLQNLASTNENSQLLSLVGKEVCVSVENADKTLSLKEGTVSSVSVIGGKAYLEVDGAVYDAEHLVQVYKDGYFLEKKMPTVESDYFAYDGDIPKNFSFEVNMGIEEGKATEIAVIIDGEKIVNPEYVKKYGDYYTINQDVFHQLEPGGHTISIMFNNAPYYTTRENVILVDVINSNPKEDTDVFLEENPVQPPKDEDEDDGDKKPEGSEGDKENVETE